MANVIFYEKPGCSANRKQKQLLLDAGHIVIAKDILKQGWNVEALARFFDGLPLSDWFNPSAPAIKSGEVSPDSLDPQQALELMRQQPILIRRPLMRSGESSMVGFDPEKVDAWIGLKTNLPAVDLEKCRKSFSEAVCENKLEYFA